VYSAIAVSMRIDIVYKRVTDIAKDVRAIDRWFNNFKDSLSKIKDELAFLRRSIIALIHNARLPDIEYR
jgi:archaellum component FlaC